MSYNGSGTFIINSTGQPVVTGTTISATVFNAFTSDIATGLTTCLTKDGQTTPTANIPMGNFKITGLGAGTALTDAATISNIQNATGTYAGTVGGTVDVITISPSPVVSAYAAGQTFSFIASGANTGAVTLNVNSLGAKAVTKNGATALAAGDIASGALVIVTYDGTRFQLAATYYPAVNRGGDTMTGALTTTAVTAAASTTTASSAGSGVANTTTNTDNTNAASHAINQITVGGTSGGDPKTVFTVTGGASWSIGADNSDSDSLKIGPNAAVGTSTAVTISTAGDVVASGNVTVSGSNKVLGVTSSSTLSQINLINTGTSGRTYSLSSGDTTFSSAFFITDQTAGLVRLGITSGGALSTTGTLAGATGYTAAGSLTLPATVGVRAKNTIKAWVAIDATSGTPTILDSFNVTSVTDNGVGDYTINITNALANANYAIGGSVKNSNDATTVYGWYESSQTTKTASLFRVRTYNSGGGFVDSVCSFFVMGE